MSSRLTIVTKNAITDSKHSLITNVSKYLLPVNGVSLLGCSESEIIRVYYRRFIRLKPLVSNRAMVRDTYLDYLRYKFRKEDYQLKRSIVLTVDNEPSGISWPRVEKTLLFLIKAVSYVPSDPGSSANLALDNLYCKKVLKNLLTIEYEKQTKISHSKSPGMMYQSLRLDFKYLEQVRDDTLNKIKTKKQALNTQVFKEFDKILIMLNESIGTML